MIYRLEQTVRLPQREHEIKNIFGETILNAGVPSVFEAYLNLTNAIIKISTDDAAKSTITSNNQKIGEIHTRVEVTKKILFLPVGIEYNYIVLNGNEYKMYESGLGANQHYFSIYNGNNVVAVIHKDDRVVNFLNKYTLYAEKDEYMFVALICTMFLESTAFCDRTGGIGNSVVDSPYYTAQKELRNKYDPSFIPKIKALEGVE